MALENQPELRIQDIPYRSNTFPSEATNEDDLQLDELLRENDVEGEPSLFYPLKTVYRIFTRERVLAQLRSYQALPNAEYYVDLICAAGTEAGRPPPYIKIFAILALIDKGDAIRDFIDAELTDETLPFYRYDYLNAKRQHYLFLKGTDTPITAFKKWLPHERSAFDTTQRMLLVPYLELGPGNMVQEYNLSDRDVLPWCRSKSNGPESPNSSMVEGAYGKVYCVDIHRDCHAFHQVLQTVKLNGDRFAVKELLKRDFNDEAQFRKELEHLKRFNGLVHDHLVTLLTSVTKGETPENKQYHFVFPFARYDLSDYWMSNHSPSWDKTTVKWVAKQLLGIMGAMDAIHVPKHLHLSTQIAKYGMHGDLKPDNILWFESHKDYRGIFVISDFGVADMHSDKSRSNIPNEKIPAVPGYRPPECDIQNGYISRRYDIWTLGCLFLEIVTWLMGGQEFVSAFKKERMKTIYVTGAKRDMFYTVKKLEGQTVGAIHLRESIVAKPTEKEWYALEVKPEVKQWIQRLHEDERCPALIHDILDMIENEMLVILSRDDKESGARDRSSSTTLKRKLQGWVSKCEVDDGYCFRGQPHPRRPVRAPTVVVAPLNKEAEDCIQMHKPALLSHNPSHDERRTKSTVLWEDLEEKE